MTISRWILLRMRNVPIKVVEKIKTHILWKSCRLRDNVKNIVERERSPMAIWRHVSYWINKTTRAQAHASSHALPSEHVSTYTCTHRETHNTYCFSTVTMVSWRRLSVTIYVHCLSCFFFHSDKPAKCRPQHEPNYHVWIKAMKPN
jgi:hypothetical protein